MGPTTLQVMTASETSGGACFAALDMEGKPWVRQQAGPGGVWGQWQQVAGNTATCRQIAMGSKSAPEQPMIFLLDASGWSWALTRGGGGSRWDTWQGPGIGQQPYSFAVLTAARHAGSGGILAFASDLDGMLWSIHQGKNASGWYGWRGPGWQNQKVAAGEIALAGQNNGCMILFAAHDSVVSYIAQQSPNGPWGPWEVLPSEKQLLLGGIVACQQGGSRGAVLWALNQLDGQVWTVFQESPGGPFSSWNGPGFVNQPVPFSRLAAAGQGNGCAMLFGLGYTGDLWAIGQTSPGGDWGTWAQLKVPGE